jgi:hypothetical protein
MTQTHAISQLSSVPTTDGKIDQNNLHEMTMSLLGGFDEISEEFQP